MKLLRDLDTLTFVQTGDLLDGKLEDQYLEVLILSVRALII
jgi:hypothetical protein